MQTPEKSIYLFTFFFKGFNWKKVNHRTQILDCVELWILGINSKSNEADCVCLPTLHVFPVM